MTDFSDSILRAEPITASRRLIDKLSDLPRSARFALHQLLRFKTGRLTVILPDGRALNFEGETKSPSAVLHLNNFSIIRKVLSGGDVGFAESYMDGDWTTPNLPALLTVFSANLDQIRSMVTGGPVTQVLHWIYHRLNANTRSGSRKNIKAHYDLGNDFYELWLDPSMTYSSARYHDGVDVLEDAQREKYAALARMIDLKADQHVLEIGCGWGGFAEYAAKDVGARVTCLTLSPSQRDYAIARMERLGLSNHVEIKLQDYRDETGVYDCVASIEMFEAVGQEYWPSFFSKVSDVLKPGGKAGLQIITIRDDLFEPYSKRADFIQRYIFPGGVLPSVERLEDEFDRAALKFDGLERFGQDYARTLNTWLMRFRDAWPQIEPQGFDERFKRMWEFYLAYCEAGFETGRIDVAQFQLTKPA